MVYAAFIKQTTRYQRVAYQRVAYQRVAYQRLTLDVNIHHPFNVVFNLLL